MNNLQLSLFLGQYLDRIDSAMAGIKQALPADLAVEGKNLLGQPAMSYPILAELKDVADDMRVAVEKLQEPSAT